MKHLVLSGLLALTLFVSPGCIKQKASLVINNDATATLSMKGGYSVAAFDAASEYIEGIVEAMGDQAEGAQDGIDALKKAKQKFTETSLVATLKKQGVTVTSSKSSEKDGWKLVEIEGQIKDTNAWAAAGGLGEEESTSKESKNPFQGMSEKLRSLKFYKTDQPGVGEVVMLAPLDTSKIKMGPQSMDIDDMPDEMRDMAEAQLDQMKEQFSLNEMKLELAVTLPGKILTAKGCKIDGQNNKHLTFSFNGGDISLSGIKDFFGMKNGVSATFEIPKGCKIKFLPKQKAQPNKKKAKQKTKKKGGFKIDDDGDK